MTERTVTYTPKTRTILADLIANPHLERPSTDIAAATGLSPSAVNSIIRILLDDGLVVERAAGKRRVYRLALNRLAEAKTAVDAPADEPPAPVRPPVATATSRPIMQADGRETWTMSGLRAAVARGEESPKFLDTVRRKLAELTED